MGYLFQILFLLFVVDVLTTLIISFVLSSFKKVNLFQEFCRIIKKYWYDLALMFYRYYDLYLLFVMRSNENNGYSNIFLNNTPFCMKYISCYVIFRLLIIKLLKLTYTNFEFEIFCYICHLQNYADSTSTIIKN